MSALSDTLGTRRSILLVAYVYPPCSNVGAHRPAAMAKYLRRMGHAVTVLTTSAYGSQPGDAGDDVVRTADLRLTRARMRGRPRVEGSYTHAGDARRRHPLAYLAVPDRMLFGWVPFALRAARALHRDRRFDAVITTSPPESAHLVGRALARRGAAWVADLRDGWSFESWRTFPTGFQRWLDVRAEERLMRAADIVTCTTGPVADELRTRTGASAVEVPHGFDPELIEAAWASSVAQPLDPDRVSVVYTGRFEAHGRDPAALLRALRELVTEAPDIARRLELVLAGSIPAEQRRLLETDLSPLRISLLGPIPHPQSLALQQAADALLLLGSRRSHVANMKLYEYLAAAKPIIAIADGTEAGRIVGELGGHVVADDPAAIKQVLARAALGALSEGPPRDGVADHAYPAPAALMAAAVERAITRSGARPASAVASRRQVPTR